MDHQQHTETTNTVKDTTESNEFEAVDHIAQPDWSATNMSVEFGQRERDASEKNFPFIY